MAASIPPPRDGQAVVDELFVRLYIAGSGPNSVRAMENLEKICATHFGSRCHMEIVDVLQEPLRALNDNVLVTPTLVKLGPGATLHIIGDLSDERKVLAGLGFRTER